jgi:DNA-binding transcriptional ArsR family regulator
MIKTTDFLRILSVDSRLRIVELLKEKGPLCVTAMAEKLGITKAAVSQHMRILKGIGLVESQRKGMLIPYSLKESILERYRPIINKICTCGCQETICHPTPQDTKKALETYKLELEKELQRVKRRLAKIKKKE